MFGNVIFWDFHTIRVLPDFAAFTHHHQASLVAVWVVPGRSTGIISDKDNCRK